MLRCFRYVSFTRPVIRLKLTVYSCLAFASPVPIAAPEAIALANTELLAVSILGFYYKLSSR
jgi:hypothetical protein